MVKRTVVEKVSRNIERMEEKVDERSFEEFEDMGLITRSIRVNVAKNADSFYNRIDSDDLRKDLFSGKGISAAASSSEIWDHIDQVNKELTKLGHPLSLIEKIRAWAYLIVTY